MPVLNDEVIKSLTFLRLPERHQASTDKLEVIIQRFPNVINSDDINDLSPSFLIIKQHMTMIFLLTLMMMANQFELIWSGKKFHH